MAEAGTYRGGCHCGQVRFEVSTDLASVIECNCSICTKRGFLWTFVDPRRFAVHAGAETLREYLFNKHLIHHLFCPICGVEAFARGTGADGEEKVAVNVRCLDEVDLASLAPVPVDGRNF